ncbi:MAG: hypothetical protein ACK4K7_03110 [Allosphingosinicella sp.]|uniref:hypothetical protein n=1 Tax=Allosphingosinicella sp. TaxID=2823234 RepID=UPI00392C66BA
MTDRPIIFSAPMVRALLAGRKTQTRRLATSPLRRCEPGDRLWVRESWYCDHVDCQRGPYLKPPGYDHDDLLEHGFMLFAADDNRWWEGPLPPFRPSLHMPRWASRLTLIVEAVKTEPLQAISEADAIAEGCPGKLAPHPEFPNEWDPSPTEEYCDLWNSLHGADSWADNPEVVAITFRVERANIDRLVDGGAR